MYLFIMLYSLVVLLYFLEGPLKELMSILFKGLVLFLLVQLIVSVVQAPCQSHNLFLLIMGYMLRLIPALYLEQREVYEKKS